LRLIFISESNIGSERTPFVSTENIQKSVTHVLNEIPQNVFQECYKKWQHYWKRRVRAHGMYFEGDHIVVDV